MGMKKVVIVDGIRSPYTKAGTVFNDLTAVELGRLTLVELLNRIHIDVSTIDEVITGNIAQPPEATNISRIIALKAGIPMRVTAYTVQRNCASGMQSIVDAFLRIAHGEAEIVVAGGVESMSNIPLLFRKQFADKFAKVYRSKSAGEKFQHLLKIRFSDLVPVIGLAVGLTDGYCGLNMGDTAEVLAKEFKISRDEQDEFSLMSHQRTERATRDGTLKEEIVPVYLPPKFEKVVDQDNGFREGQSMQALGKLRPAFDRKFGTVTAGNSSQITDGAAFVLVTSEQKAKEMGWEVLGSIRSHAFAGLDPKRMGLGPVYASAIALKKAGVSLKDIQLIEMNEAFAAQVIANERSFASRKFAKENLGLGEPLGEIDRDILNVNGGAIAIGHPVGSSGTRITLTLLKEMKRRNIETGLATLCVGGGQGAALVLERN